LVESDWVCHSDHNARLKNKKSTWIQVPYKKTSRKANLKATNLVAANLENADLSDAQLQEADLTIANCKGAILTDA
jgi:uncharacterized protein YjbI with pentapeptide repeats